MKKNLKRSISVLSGLLLVLTVTLAVLAPVSVSAASFKKSKPKIAGSSAYLDNSVSLTWTAVKGAKKYEIQRAMVKPKNGKTGKWKKWKTVKGTTIKAAATGDYKYRVRAINKKKKSKWSAPKRIFAASARITNIGDEAPERFFTLRYSGTFEFRVEIKNKTKSPMGFLRSGSRVGSQHTVYAINKSNGKIMGKWEGYLDTNGIAKKVNSNSTQTIYIYASVPYSEAAVANWENYKKCRFLITSIFYPNPETEPTSKQMTITYSNVDFKDSSIPAK